MERNVIQHYKKDGVWYEATYRVDVRSDRADDEVVYRKVHNSDKPCECVRKPE